MTKAFGFDTLFNLITRLGTGADPSTATSYLQKQIADAQLEVAFQSDWLARKIIKVPANDATREWRGWQAEADDIEALEAEEKRLGVQRKVRRGLTLARLYGGAGIIMGVRSDAPEEELNPESVGEGDLKWLHVLPRGRLLAGEPIADLQNPLFGEPQFYTVTTRDGKSWKIHPSRVIRFMGDEPADIDAATSVNLQGWGQSVLISVDDAIKQFGTATQGASAMLGDAKVDVIRIPQLSQNMATDAYSSNLSNRFALAALLKSQFGFLLMDKEEEWQRISQSFSQIPELVRTFMLTVSGAADIPATRLFGQSPQGLDATGDGDLQNYYDRLAGDQENEITPAMDKLDEVLIRSATGARDEATYYEWNELYGMSETQKADVFQKNMTSIEKLVTNNLVPELALAEATQNMIIELGIMPGFEQALEDNPDELPQDEPVVDPLLTGEAPTPGTSPATAKPTSAAAVARLKAAVGVDSRHRRHRVGDGRRRYRVADAQPRTLYVRRDVLNAEEIVRWAKGEGFETTLPAAELHVTIAFSRAPVDWMKAGSDEFGAKDGEMVIPPGGPRLVERLGNYSCLLFTSSWLTWRHQSIVRAGASWEWEDYQPHVSISKDPTIRIDKMTPYRGEIKLGPEIFEEVNDEWKQKVVEDKGWRA